MQITKKEAESLKWWIDWTEEHMHENVLSFEKQTLSSESDVDIIWIRESEKAILDLKNRMVAELSLRII